jgi:uncharacterized membrane protein
MWQIIKENTATMPIQYSPTQWVLAFFFYAFIGWIWEVSYVSIKEQKAQNRGFLFGPIIPIYGFGALIILLSTSGVRDYWYWVFILGAVSASILELITGLLMEALFKVRYWDYSHLRFNVRGYIAPSVSLVWGVFSLFLVYAVNPPVENLITNIVEPWDRIWGLVLLLALAIDTTKSVQDALDLKSLLKRYADVEAVRESLAERVKVLNEDISENLDDLRETVKHLQLSYDKMSDNAVQRARRLLKRNPHATSRHFTETLDQIKERLSKTLK